MDKFSLFAAKFCRIGLNCVKIQAMIDFDTTTILETGYEQLKLRRNNGYCIFLALLI